MGIISLEGIDFFAYHGFSDEERSTGNKYSVDIYLSTDFSTAAVTDDLEGTINYEELYTIIAQEMHIPSRLLENIAHRIVEKISNSYSQIDWIEVSVSKYNPPVGGICYRSKVTLRK
jgi:dihydroneopterin aldolase